MRKIAQNYFAYWLLGLLVFILIILAYQGHSYYGTSLGERFFHADHEQLKPSGLIGHGLGLIGSFMMVVGVTTYMLRKRVRRLASFGNIKKWLEFHIVLCSVGPLFVLFHTAFKFGGLVAISFWSMVAVVLSGVIGRYIYNQIPRSIHGREFSLNEVRAMKKDIQQIMGQVLSNVQTQDWQDIFNTINHPVNQNSGNLVTQIIRAHVQDWRAVSAFKMTLRQAELPPTDRKNILGLIRQELSLNRKIGRLQTMQNLFRYWHVAHLPFALIMLVIMTVHIVITFLFGYRWIF